MLSRFSPYVHFSSFAELYFYLYSFLYFLSLLCTALANCTAFNGIASGEIVSFFSSELFFSLEILSHQSVYIVIQFL